MELGRALEHNNVHLTTRKCLPRVYGSRLTFLGLQIASVLFGLLLLGVHSTDYLELFTGILITPSSRHWKGPGGESGGLHRI